MKVIGGKKDESHILNQYKKYVKWCKAAGVNNVGFVKWREIRRNYKTEKL